MKRIVVGAGILLGLCAFAAARQDHKKMEAPKPGKEQELLKQFEGDWDAHSRMTGEAGKVDESTGSQTCKMTLGGYWLEMDFHGTERGKTFTGHGMVGYDPHKAKYVGVWLNDMCPFMMPFEGTADSAGKTWEFSMKGDDPMTGKPSNVHMTWKITDKDHYTFKFTCPDETSKDHSTGDILFTRKGAK